MRKSTADPCPAALLNGSGDHEWGSRGGGGPLEGLAQESAAQGRRGVRGHHGALDGRRGREGRRQAAAKEAGGDDGLEGCRKASMPLGLHLCAQGKQEADQVNQIIIEGCTKESQRTRTQQPMKPRRHHEHDPRATPEATPSCAPSDAHRAIGKAIQDLRSVRSYARST